MGKQYITWKKISNQYYAYLEYGYKQDGRHKTRSIYLGKDYESALYKFEHVLPSTGQFPMNYFTHRRLLEELKDKMPEGARYKHVHTEEKVEDKIKEIIEEYSDNNNVKTVLEFAIGALRDEKVLEAIRKMQNADFERINALLDNYPIK